MPWSSALSSALLGALRPDDAVRDPGRLDGVDRRCRRVDRVSHPARRGRPGAVCRDRLRPGRRASACRRRRGARSRSASVRTRDHRSRVAPACRRSASHAAWPASVGSTSVPRRSFGSGRRRMSPAVSIRSSRLVIAPLDSRRSVGQHPGRALIRRPDAPQPAEELERAPVEAGTRRASPPSTRRNCGRGCGSARRSPRSRVEVGDLARPDDEAVVEGIERSGASGATRGLVIATSVDPPTPSRQPTRYAITRC